MHRPRSDAAVGVLQSQDTGPAVRHVRHPRHLRHARHSDTRHSDTLRHDTRISTVQPPSDTGQTQARHLRHRRHQCQSTPLRHRSDTTPTPPTPPTLRHIRAQSPHRCPHVAVPRAECERDGLLELVGLVSNCDEWMALWRSEISAGWHGRASTRALNYLHHGSLAADQMPWKPHLPTALAPVTVSLLSLPIVSSGSSLEDAIKLSCFCFCFGRARVSLRQQRQNSGVRAGFGFGIRRRRIRRRRRQE